MYHVSDVGLITPLRDGMNLVAKEYVAAKSDFGVLILSELAGAANELGEAILVNPMDKNDVARAIQSALNCSAEEQAAKLRVMQKRLKEYTVVHWLNDFLRQLDESKKMQESQRTKFLSAESVVEIARKYKMSRKKLLLLDYDGTLVPFSKHPGLATPDQNLMGLLESLASDATTDITIISGRDHDCLDRWFSHLPVNLISEHGAGIRLKGGEWRYFLEVKESWKPIILPVLELFTQRSPGSFIEEKPHTLVWHYRNVQSELGTMRSRELIDNLNHLVRNSPLRILNGNKVVEVRMGGIDKGAVTRKLLEDNHYDFIMAVGDDKTDEDMFRVLPQNAFTIKIGSENTLANFHLTDQANVLTMLRAFSSEAEFIISEL
jgi:trehalose 6-phosphate synthase/phosphatase